MAFFEIWVFMRNNELKISSLLCALMCHIATFLLVMVIIPVFCGGWRDILWISLRIAAAIAVAVLFTWSFRDINAIVYFFMSMVQDILAFVFRPLLCRIYGISMTSLGEFEYIGQVFVWITAIVILQMAVIAVVNSIKNTG